MSLRAPVHLGEEEFLRGCHYLPQSHVFRRDKEEEEESRDSLALFRSPSSLESRLKLIRKTPCEVVVDTGESGVRAPAAGGAEGALSVCERERGCRRH